jgi:hypothetical protein
MDGRLKRLTGLGRKTMKRSHAWGMTIFVAVAIAFGVAAAGSAAAGNAIQENRAADPAKPAPNAKPPEPVQEVAAEQRANQVKAETPSNAEAQEAQQAGCPGKKVRHIDSDHAHTPSEPPSEPIEFTVHESSSVLNFGSNRGTRFDYIVLRATEPIPTNVYSSDFEIDSFEPMRRIGEASLESVHLPAPNYTPPHFFNHRKEIGFNLCVSSGQDADAGTYTGQFELVGPGTIETTTITQTAQLKAEDQTFVWSFVAVLVFALILLVMNQLILPASPTKDEWKAWVARIVVIVFALSAAASAMLVAWSQNPTWGENLWVAIGALIATAFAAAGVGSTLTAAAAQFDQSQNTDDPKDAEH